MSPGRRYAIVTKVGAGGLLLLLLAACESGPSTQDPPGLLKSSADQPARRASEMLGALKLGDRALLQACLERYEASSTPGRTWHLADPKLVAMTATADQALDDDTRRANPDGWLDRGDMRSAIMPDDGDVDDARCLVCRYDMDDGAAEPLQLFGVETVDNCT